MSEPTTTPEHGLRARLGRLSPAVLAVIGVLVASGIGSGGYYAYRAYDYVQHDNDFCMQCHLMSEPFEAFAQSAHQGLGCKACHRPNLLDRSQMGLTAIVEDPDQVGAHAEVPNETCAECHIAGDPEKWRLIANSAGHRAHLESDDPALAGLQCVECHSTSVHEFSPIDRTCAQSGCHEDKTLQLGSMSELTIHCAACHTFVTPVAGEAGILGSEIDAAILPDQGECLSCHVMRTLVAMPPTDPHEGGCAACHNPHEQTEPAQAAASCASAGCHTDLAGETPFHRGIQGQVLGDCLYCHQAHDFSLDGGDCASCHEALEASDGTIEGEQFVHIEHEGLECASCHTSTEAHGLSTVVAVQDCRSCHHTQPVAQSCDRCHEPADAGAELYRLRRPVSFSVGTDDPNRVMTFPHEAHAGEDCASCHTEGLALAPPPDLDCTTCHQDHHTPESDCASCHVVAPVSAHPPSEAHVTCSGAGCHTDVPFESVPRTRAFCLGCHQGLREHEPQQVCSECHTLPAPRAGEGHLW